MKKWAPSHKNDRKHTEITLGVVIKKEGSHRLYFRDVLIKEGADKQLFLASGHGINFDKKHPLEEVFKS